ncbi:hypothetical protein M9H77_00966 [Catharanthus roseus]|uniref:Uncharacterized protein n=1 Tax=Catharanthus roseus TaxID=4058 RepID=A0ACC0C4G8_CATRO|nr:hypothetical protein M9H77_00966 [Catharanthus roseus]
MLNLEDQYVISLNNMEVVVCFSNLKMGAATLTGSSIRILRCRFLSPPPVPIAAAASPLSSPLTNCCIRPLMESHNTSSSSSSSSSASFSAFSHSSRSGGRGRSMVMKDYNRERPKGSGGGRGGGKDKIDALGRLLTRVLRHMGSELNLNMRSDGFVKVEDLLKLNLKTFANIPLRSHSVDDIREAVRKDNKQRFSLVEENGELWIRANQGHTIPCKPLDANTVFILVRPKKTEKGKENSSVPRKVDDTVETESLLKPILSAEEVPVCVHGTYKRYLESILEQGLKRMKRLHVHFSCGIPTDGEVISGMRRDVNVLIFLDVRKALDVSLELKSKKPLLFTSLILHCIMQVFDTQFVLAMNFLLVSTKGLFHKSCTKIQEVFIIIPHNLPYIQQESRIHYPIAINSSQRLRPPSSSKSDNPILSSFLKRAKQSVLCVFLYLKSWASNYVVTVLISSSRLP